MIRVTVRFLFYCSNWIALIQVVKLIRQARLRFLSLSTLSTVLITRVIQRKTLKKRYLVAKLTAAETQPWGGDQFGIAKK